METGSERSGQAMLLAILALGGAILGATTIAGFLMLYQIRATTDSENSAKAVFAADSGVEWALFSFYCGPTARCAAPPPLPGNPPGTLGDGAVVDVTCYDSSGVATTTCYATTTAAAASAIAKGTSLDAKRAFFLGLGNAPAAAP